MAKITVNREALREIIEIYFDGFNDCACCPLYPDDCRKKNRDWECVNKILFQYLQEKD